MKKTLLTILAAAAAMTMSAQTPVTYFEDDFEWLEPWSSLTPAGNTIAENDVDVTCQQLSTNKVKIDGTDVSTYQALTAKGYEFPITKDPDKSARQAGAQTYLQRNYIKFGLTGYFSGITIPKLTTFPGENETAAISFDWCSMRRGNNAPDAPKPWDPTKLVVIVKNGDNEQQFLVPEHTFADGDNYEWIPATVELTGAKIDGDTRITVRNIDAQWPGKAAENTDKVRWFIDNIKVYKAESAGLGTVEADNNAPVEYFNLQGMRVAEPTTGLYIRRQGDKVTKVVLK